MQLWRTGSWINSLTGSTESLHDWGKIRAELLWQWWFLCARCWSGSVCVQRNGGRADVCCYSIRQRGCGGTSREMHLGAQLHAPSSPHIQARGPSMKSGLSEHTSVVSTAVYLVESFFPPTHNSCPLFWTDAHKSLGGQSVIWDRLSSSCCDERRGEGSGHHSDYSCFLMLPGQSKDSLKYKHTPCIQWPCLWQDRAIKHNQTTQLILPFA